MGFYQVISTTYGIVCTNNLKNWAKLNIKLAPLKNRKIFLLQCRRFGLFPKHITDQTKGVSKLIDIHEGRTGQMINTFSHKLNCKVLNLEIRVTHGHIERTKGVLAKLRNEIKNALPPHILNEFLRRQNIRYNKYFYKIRDTHRGKLEALRGERRSKIKIKDSWFKNLTNLDFPREVRDILSLGPNFSLPVTLKDISIPHILADIEYSISLINNNDNNQKNIYSAQATNIITNFVHKEEKVFSEEIEYFNKTKIFLKNHPEVYITKSDKGNSTVALYKQQYMELAELLLNDETYYKKIPRDPTSTIQQKANKIVSDLKKQKQITDVIAKNLTIYNSICPKFYGLPKVHKPTLSLRPIISSVDSPTSKLTGFITQILATSYDYNNEYYVTDSFKFSTFINDFLLPNNFQIISLDVVSLFTNLSLELVLESITKNWTRIRNNTDISQSNFLEIIRFIFNNTCFAYNNQFYKQTFGTPMGSKISPILAQYVLDDLLQECIPKLSYKLPFLKKYVDDLICAIPLNGEEEILRVFNNYNKYIQFTIETENNNSVPFLDTKLIRCEENNKIILDWYIKPSSSGRYLNYFSYHPERMKINLILCLKNRVTSISHPTLRVNNLRRVYNLLLDNSYPKHLLNKLLFSTSETVIADNTDQNRTANSNPRKHYVSFPYIRDLTPKLANIFKGKDLIVANKTLKTTTTLFTRLKDKTNNINKSNLVYQISCHNCDKKYIGQTSRCLKDRLASHKSDIRLRPDACALSQHTNNTGHLPDFENVKIIDFEKNYFKRNFLEMVYINNQKNYMNKRSDVQHLNVIYSNLLQISNREEVRCLQLPQT